MQMVAHLSTQNLFFSPRKLEFYIYVIEVPPRGAFGFLHNNCASLPSDVDIFWNVDSLIAENGLHLLNRGGKICGIHLTVPVS